MSLAKELSELEVLAFQWILDGKANQVKELVENSKIRVNCLNKDGMNLLDQACFKGDKDLVKFLLENGADVDNRGHHQGYTSLMFAALSGKPAICQQLLDAGARAHAQNSIGKTASELAAFVAQFDCVSVISSYISYEDIRRVINPNNPSGTEIVYPKQLVKFVHNLTKTHEIHPVSLVFHVMQEELVLEHRQKILYTVDRLFEKQLRCKEPNEMMSIKLWLILFTLRELLKFIERKQKDSESSVESSKLASMFAKNLLQMNENDLVRPIEEQFIRNAILAFPYKQSLVHEAIVKGIKNIKLGNPPSAYIVVCQALFGPRFVETAQFCSTCSKASSQKRCKSCKTPYCSEKCQRFDWSMHKKFCDAIKRRKNEAEIVENTENLSIKEV